MGQTGTIKRIINPLKEKYYFKKYSQAALGSSEWLIKMEITFGGLAIEVPRNKVSPDDPRKIERLAKGGMTGGDRMLHHGYAQHYAQYLAPYLQKDRRLTVCEIGILKGSGLAIWCDMFRDARVLGLDIDLGHTISNMENLNKLGAFKHNQPELHEFDQLQDNGELLANILKGEKIDICIDDGLHSNKSVLNTLKNVLPHLSEDAVYFIEDNDKVQQEIKTQYPHFKVDQQGALTIIQL